MEEIILYTKFNNCEVCTALVPHTDTICPECKMLQILKGEREVDENDYKVPGV